MTKMIVAVGAFLFAAAGLADHAVRTVGSLLVTNDAEVITLATVAAGQTGVPADMPDPVFWIDASDTNGWTVTKDADGYVRVETVPSKGGSKRYATTAVSAENGDTWFGWKYNETTLYKPGNPYFIDDPDLIPGKALDFVKPGTSGYAARIGLVFDKVPEFEGAAPTNAVFNIGTVIAVYGSHDGRGWFLGGGRSSGGMTYEWNRKPTQQLANEKYYDYTSAAIQSRTGMNNAQANGVLRHDGLPTAPVNVGFNHAWEVVSWTMASASAVATGIGLGDTRGEGFERTGQQRIAEMLIFDEVLPLEMVEKIETYLNLKWFGRKLAGYGGKAEIGTLRSNTRESVSDETSGIVTEIAVGEGEELTVGRIEGGRGLKSRIRKTGAGTLAVRDASAYGGTIALAGGTLTVPLKPIPLTVEHIVTNCCYHADASRAGDVVLSQEEDGSERVLGWKNLAGGTYWGEPLMLAPIANNRRPYFRRDALGEGMHLVDMGPYGYDNGCYLSFATNAAGATYPKEVAVDGIVTVVAVYGAHGSGGNFFNSRPWSRSNISAVDNYRGWSNSGNMLDTNVFDTVRGLSAASAVVFADGIRRDPGEAFAKPGYQVLAVRNPGTDAITRLGLGDGKLGFGGFSLGEIFIFRRQLSDNEMTDLSAYLAWKWFGTVLNGYEAESFPAKSAVISRVEVESPSCISVGSGKTVRLGKVKLGSGLTVTGGGTLEIETLDNPENRVIDAVNGTVKITGTYDPASDAEIAPDPAYRLDPSDTSRLEVVESGGKRCVVRARDPAMRRELYAPTSIRMPWLDTDVLPEKLPVLNFGPYSSSGCTMVFDRPIDAVRSVYVIWAPNDDATDHYRFIFGSCDQMHRDPLRGTLIDYHCGMNANADGLLPLFHGYTSQSHIITGEIYVDGVRTNRLFAPKAGEIRLIEMHHAAPAHIAAFANDRTMSSRNGGSMFGETLIYTRELSEREKVATRNYLMKKWFGKKDDELAALPEYSEDGRLRKLSGSGKFVKSGCNTLVVQDMTAYTGTVTVASGTLKLARPMAAVSPVLVSDGLVFHVDANEGIEFAEGTDASVARWNSRLGDGWSAVAAKDVLDTNVNYAEYPTLRHGMFDNTPFVRMNHNRQFMIFCKNGKRARIKNIKTVFWVLGTDDGSGNTLGGGFLLGGGNAKNPDDALSLYDWHRGGSDAGSYRRSCVDPLTSGSATTSVRDGEWYKDGVQVDGHAVGLGSNEWHYVTAKPKVSQNHNPATADGFAFDGRLVNELVNGEKENYRHRAGGQSLAEVLIYDRTLTEEERLCVEAYLSGKWGFTQALSTNSVDMVIAEGAVLDCSGFRQYVASLSGAGTVDGDIGAARLVADAQALSHPVVTGAFVLPAAVDIELRNLPSQVDGKKIKILDCARLESPDGVELAFSGEGLPDGASARLTHRDGALYVRFRSRGMVFVVR